MLFNKIEVENWNRKDSFFHYINEIPCTYSMTVNIDVTNLLAYTKANNFKFFPSILYAISNIVNKHKEFRMDIGRDGEIGYYSVSNPCFTVFHSETETITDVWTEYTNNFFEFLTLYDEDMKLYSNIKAGSKPFEGSNIFNVSCIPWTSFTGFNLNLQKGYDYLLPIFTLGKYFSDGNKFLLPLAIQVHHAVCDGFHLARFVNDLQVFLDVFTSDLSEKINCNLYTNRLCLVPISHDFDEDIFKNFTDEISKYMLITTTKTVDEAKDLTEIFINQRKTQTGFFYAITLKETGEFIGVTGLEDFKKCVPDYSVWVKKDAWGKGYAKESFNGMMNLAKDMNVKKIIYHTDKRNIGSRKIALCYNGKKIVDNKEVITPDGRVLNVETYEIDIV